MKIEKMVISLKMDRPINPDIHYISPGGYEILFSNGELISFDFNLGYKKIDRTDDSIVHFAFYDLDTESFPDAERLCKNLLCSQVKEIVECYVYTGEEDGNAEINPINITELLFVIDNGEDVPVTDVKIGADILYRFNWEMYNEQND